MQKLDLQLAFFATMAVALIVIESYSGVLHNVRVALFVLVKPVVEIAETPTLLNKILERNFADRNKLRQQLTAIKQENTVLRERVIELEYEELRNRWLAELLEAREKIDYPILSANLVSVQLLPMSHKIVLDRGSKHDVYIGQPVLDPRGLIGQVTEVAWSDSAVTLITDAGHSVPVRIRRNGLFAIAHGLGERNQLLISGLRVSQDVEVGDVLITTGLGNRFPAGYPVAEITVVEHNRNAPFAEILAAPLATIDPDFEVLMVWNNEANMLDSPSSLSMNEQSENQ